MNGIVLKAAWHWIRDCNVKNDALEEPGRTLLYGGPLSTWFSVDGDQIFAGDPRLGPAVAK
jgi:hypothetical protein